LTSALLPLRSAVRDRLAADTELSSVPRHDAALPGSGALFPAIVLGEKTERPMESFSRRGSVASIVVEVHSREADDVELLTLATRIQEVLESPPLPLTGFTVVRAQTSVVRTLMDEDGLTRRADVRYEVTAQSQ
jgi:hypothetical protein